MEKEISKEDLLVTEKVLKQLLNDNKSLYTNETLLELGKKVFEKPLYHEFKKKEFVEKQKDHQEARKRKKVEKEDIKEDEEEGKFVTIGHFKSCFKIKNATPRQGQLCPMARGKFEFKFGHNPEHAIEDLKDFTHVWLIFLFHENRERPLNINTMRMKIRPPRLNGDRVSIYATRTPHRPNKIGLSKAKIEKIVGPTIYLSGIDLIDNTPILDIKPYIPEYDSIQKDEIVKVPKWITQESEIKKVDFTKEALESLDSLVSKLEYYSTFNEIKDAIVQVLQLDPRSISRKKTQDTNYAFYIDCLNVVVFIKDGVCLVEKIELVTDFTELLKMQHDKVLEQKFSSSKNQDEDDCE